MAVMIDSFVSYNLLLLGVNDIGVLHYNLRPTQMFHIKSETTEGVYQINCMNFYQVIQNY